MRIFIGIKLDESTLAHTEKFLKPFKKISTPIKWTRLENLHLTLKFIGDITPTEYAHILGFLEKKDFNTGPIDMTLSGCGSFNRGRGGALSIFWLGITPDPRLEDLYQRLEDAMSRAGVPKEEREFTPHITAGRNKRNFNFKPIFQLIEENSDRFIARQKITAFQVFKSQLTPGGPIYSLLTEIPIDAA